MWMHTEEPHGKQVNTCQLPVYSHLGNSFILARSVSSCGQSENVLSCMCIHSLKSIFNMQPWNP